MYFDNLNPKGGFMYNKFYMKTILLIFTLIMLQSPLHSQPELRSSVFGSSGGIVENGSYRSSFTVGQTATGLSSNSTYIHRAGFWEAVNLVVSVEDIGSELPISFGLSQNYPNPFNPTTTINYSVPEESFVSIQVYDILGRLVASLVNEEKTVGYHEVTFNAVSIASGTYFYRMDAGDFIDVKKLIVLK